ncbi:MAG: ester cyclase [Pleurocapsa minor GSE-CHR-MK-17-07R]|jgi:predicted ester cyclase|nr:ester cyclase [Pleurocapsa minor GSE-CHR-MK 17-07R]
MNAVRFVKQGVLLLVCVFALAGASLIAAQDAATDVSAEEESLRNVSIQNALALTAGDLDAVIETLAENYVVHSPLGDLDREGFRAFVQAVTASLSDFTVTTDASIVEGTTVAGRSTWAGVFDGEPFASPFGLLEPTGQPVTVIVHTYFRFDEEGLIVEEWTMTDLLGFFTQLGAFPAPA